MSSREDMIGIARLEAHHRHPGRVACITLRVCSKLRIKFNCLEVAGFAGGILGFGPVVQNCCG